MERNYKVVMSAKLSEEYEPRYVVVDINDESKILDDAQGYGYRTIKKAYAAYGYKHADPKVKHDRRVAQQRVEQWCKTHPEIMADLEDCDVWAMKDGRKGLSKEEIAKYLADKGFTDLKFTIEQFVKYMKYQ